MSPMAPSSEDFWVIQKKWPRRIFWAAIVVAVGYLLTNLTVIDDYTDRARASELLVLTNEAREQIATELRENPQRKISLDASTLIPEATNTRSKEGEKIEIAYREIAGNGQIKVYTPQLGVLLILTPKVTNNEVAWSCWGRPLGKIPAMCRGNS